MSSPYILIDGQFCKIEEKLFTPADLDNLLFKESLRSIRNQLMFWEDHRAILNFQFQLLNQPQPLILKDSGRELKRQIERVLVKNKLFKSSKISISFFKQGNAVSYTIHAEEIRQTRYELNELGIMLDTFTKIFKSASPLSTLRIGSDNYWKVVSSAKNSHLQEMLLLNDNQSLVEVPGKNIYLVTGSEIWTPSPVTGAYINPAKRIIQHISQKNGLVFLEKDDLTEADLRDADEVFLANDIDGIQWVKAFGLKRYFNKTVKMLNEEFNRELVQ